MKKILEVKNISSDIKEGEYISIIRPSGCGKSTLLSIISGLESKCSGEIYYVEGLLKKYKYLNFEV